MQRLFSAIDAESEGRPKATFGPVPRTSAFFASLSPRTLAWSASVAAVLLLLLGGVIGALVKSHLTAYDTEEMNLAARDLDLGREAASPHALVRFAEDARVADIRALLDKYQASIIGSTGGGMFRLQFGDRALSRQDQAGLINDLASEKIVNLATPAS